MFPQEFEKDDDSNGHIDFITSASVSYYNFLLGRYPIGTNFWKFPVTNETAFSAISGKEDNLAMLTQIFRKFYYREFPLLSISSRSFRIFWLKDSDFLATFPVNFGTICNRFEIFRTFPLHGKRP